MKSFFGGVFSVLLLTAFIFSAMLVYNNSSLSYDQTKGLEVKVTQNGYEISGKNYSLEGFLGEYSRFLPHSFKASWLLREKAEERAEDLFKNFYQNP